jgi:hypothetical protein
MNPFQRLYKFAWVRMDKAVRDFHFGMVKKSCLDRVDGVAICNMSIEQDHQDGFLNLTRDAMALIKSLDPRRYRRVCRQFDYVVNVPLISGGDYEHKGKICNVDYAKFLAVPHPPWRTRSYACLLIHEATHGVLAEKGILYDNKNWQRIERLCHLEEYRFALHFEPGFADDFIGPFDPERWKLYWGPRQDRLIASWNRLREAIRASSDRSK